MNKEQLKNKNISTIMLKWEEEFQQFGYIQKEDELLKDLYELNEQTEFESVSHLLTIAALSRIAKNQKDSISIAWLNKAIKLYPENVRANEYLKHYESRNYRDFLKILSFPAIRETDNRTAKRKIAEEYISISRQFLSVAEDELDQLNKSLKIVQKFNDSELLEMYNSMIDILDETIGVTAQLLKSSEEYEQSISGVFYTSTHFESIKTCISEINQLRNEWMSIFAHQTDESAKNEISSLEELNKMIGLHSVKSRVNDYYQFLKYQKTRKSLGFKMKDEISLNMILTGNPGTGKTTLARLFARLYHELGVLPSEDVIEADRSQLVGAYVGQTEENVRKIVEKAIGGVLFIDEAYSLKREGQTGNDYGQTAIDTLVSLMTGKEFGGKFAVILAGYPEEMRQFLDANPGLRSRFPESNQIQLPDYSNEELMLIAEKLAMDNDYILTDEGKIELAKRIVKEQVDDTFGNARTVRNIVLDAIFKKGSNSRDDQNILQFTLLEKSDFEVTEENDTLNPTQKLHNLIGLHSLKEEVKSLISFVKVQQIRREHNLPSVPIQLHAVFSGNPGTGKTTVASIYAEFLKECGILKRGHLVVSSRADFVAGYTGQTAIKTKKKIREALGGVLFIDEAYSLLGHASGDFGKEVIDTLVDEMTKHNENLVVVLAGYPKQMEELLQSNPGLKSRFKKFFHFQDYQAEELLEIMKHYSTRYKFELTEECEEFILEKLQNSSINGNGRFATNLIDEAIQFQALRLINEVDATNLLEESAYIRLEDIEKAMERIVEGE